MLMSERAVGKMFSVYGDYALMKVRIWCTYYAIFTLYM